MVIPGIIIAYFIIIIVVGIFSRRKARDADDFFVAGRKGSTLFITGSLLATIIGGSAVMVTSNLGFIQGLTGSWWLLVGSIGLIFLGWLLAGKVRSFGLYTLPGLVEKQYDKRVALVSSFLIVIAWIGVIGAQIIAAGSIMDALGIGDARIWMIAFSVVFVLYTIVGGQHAIIRTDSLQALIIFAGIIGAAVVVVLKLGGAGDFWNSMTPARVSFPLSAQFGWYDLFKYLMLVGLAYLVGPDMYSRLFCAKDSSTARKAAYWTAFLIIPIALSLVFIGMGASVLFPDVSAGQAFPVVIKELLNPVLGGLVLAALLCAFMSSADTTLMTAGTILSMDIAGKLQPSLDKDTLLRISKWGIAVMGLAALLLALYLKDIVNTILFAYTVYTGGLIIPVLAGFYREKLGITIWGAIAAIVAGGVVALVAKIGDIKYLDVISLGVSAVFLFGVSFVENRFRTVKQ